MTAVVKLKRHLLNERKAMTNLDSVLKSRDITLPTKVPIVKAIVSLGVTYGWESWIIKKAECWRIDAFKLWCWRRLLRVSWIARRSNQIKSNQKRNQTQPWIFIERTDAEAPILWPPVVKSWLIGKHSDTGKDPRQEDKGVTEDDVVGWYRHNRHKSEQNTGDGEGQGSDFLRY